MLKIMKTCIIIPNYNGNHFLEKCMLALENQSKHDFSILFVDNDSKDESIKSIKSYMEKEPERVLLIENEENYGFAKAVNQGILFAKEAGARYALLLNNDTEVDPFFVEKLVEFMEEREAKGEKVFALSSKMVKMHDPRLMDDAGDELCVLGFPFQRGLEDSEKNWNTPEEVFSACAGAALSMHWKKPDYLTKSTSRILRMLIFPSAHSFMAIRFTSVRKQFVSMSVPEQAGESTVISR